MKWFLLVVALLLCLNGYIVSEIHNKLGQIITSLNPLYLTVLANTEEIETDSNLYLKSELTNEPEAEELSEAEIDAEIEQGFEEVLQPYPHIYFVDEEDGSFRIDYVSSKLIIERKNIKSISWPKGEIKIEFEK